MFASPDRYDVSFTWVVFQHHSQLSHSRYAANVSCPTASRHPLILSFLYLRIASEAEFTVDARRMAPH